MGPRRFIARSPRATLAHAEPPCVQQTSRLGASQALETAGGFRSFWAVRCRFCATLIPPLAASPLAVTRRGAATLVRLEHKTLTRRRSASIARLVVSGGRAPQPAGDSSRPADAVLRHALIIGTSQHRWRPF